MLKVTVHLHRLHHVKGRLRPSRVLSQVAQSTETALYSLHDDRHIITRSVQIGGHMPTRAFDRLSTTVGGQFQKHEKALADAFSERCHHGESADHFDLISTLARLLSIY